MMLMCVRVYNWFLQVKDEEQDDYDDDDDVASDLNMVCTNIQEIDPVSYKNFSSVHCLLTDEYSEFIDFCH